MPEGHSEACAEVEKEDDDSMALTTNPVGGVDRCLAALGESKGMRSPSASVGSPGAAGLAQGMPDPGPWDSLKD